MDSHGRQGPYAASSQAARASDGDPRAAGCTRREVLEGMAAGVLASACRKADGPPSGGSRFDGLPVERVDSFITPAADFFVRDHFGVPASARLAPGQWRVEVMGDVRHSRTYALDELAGTATVTRPVTLECAGNAGRNGLGWQGGPRAWSGASTGVFTGVSLAPLLAAAGPADSATEVVFEGLDEGAERDERERVRFARSLSLRDALAPDVMLATRMNGEPLPALHGGPLRLVCPGRYATDSVKWLSRITVLTKPFQGFFQTRRYRRATPAAPAGNPLGRLRVQSEISRPRAGERIPVGLLLEIRGVAWGGTGVERVEVSTDGGMHFSMADFVDAARPDCWRRWVYRWTPEHPGPRLLLARAVDSSGEAQPLASDEELGLSFSVSGPDRVQYANNSAPVVPVTVA